MTNTSIVQRPEYSRDTAKAGRPAASEVFRTRTRRRVVLFAMLLVLLVGVVLFSVSVGQYHIPVGDVPRILIAGPEGASLAESAAPSTGTTGGRRAGCQRRVDAGGVC